MKVKQANMFKLMLISLVLQTILINLAMANDDEVDADFLEFLADMEEATGSGFDAWLNADDEDHFSVNTDEEIESTELQK